MARSVAFDVDKAIDAAMRAFWKSGYVGTSLRDLLAATGLGEGSFYNTLKSKKNLYLECLKRYSTLELESRLNALASASSMAIGLRTMFRLELDALDDPKRPSPMCMMVGMVTPEVLADADLRKIVEGGRQYYEGYLAGLIRRDIALGLVSDSTDADSVASLLTIFGQGMNRIALVHYDRSALEIQIEIFLNSLGFIEPNRSTLTSKSRRSVS